MNPEVYTLPPEEHAVWPDALASSGGFIGMDPWMQFVERVYGYRAYRLVARTGDEITGLLALSHVKHLLFGNYLVTAPFGSYGGFAFSATESCNALLDQARVLAEELGVQYVNVRSAEGGRTPPAGWLQEPVYATYRAELTPDAESLLATYSPNHRNHIRKSLKKGFKIRFGRLDLLDDAYEVLARSMHELGSPYHSKTYLRAMAKTMGENLEFGVVYGLHGELAGAGVFILQGDVATNLHANILRAFRSDYAGEFLYWSVIRRYGEMGFRIFDMGRSLIGSGNEQFKMKWKPRKEALSYWYALRGGASLPALNQKNPKFRLAIWAWQRLPGPVVQILGPSLIRGLA